MSVRKIAPGDLERRIFRLKNSELFPSGGKFKKTDGKMLKHDGKSSKSDGKILRHDGKLKTWLKEDPNDGLRRFLHFLLIKQNTPYHF
jgi:hypothetical protein